MHFEFQLYKVCHYFFDKWADQSLDIFIHVSETFVQPLHLDDS